jgi:hypothetical protein
VLLFEHFVHTECFFYSVSEHGNSHGIYRLMQDFCSQERDKLHSVIDFDIKVKRL